MESVKQSILFHNRPITEVKFHPDGDVFFASSKDTTATMMNLDGQLLGSFEQHEGAITTLDAIDNTLVTSGLDLRILRWDILKGVVQGEYKVDSVVRGIDLRGQGVFCTDKSMNKESFVGMIDLRSNKYTKILPLKVSSTKTYKHGDCVVFSDVDGCVSKIDLRNNQIISTQRIHQSRITNIRPSFCRSFFVTSSDDFSVKIVDFETLAIKKKFECEEPINCACISSGNNILVAVGGINARDVTTTKGKGTFDTYFYDVVTRKKIGSYKTHFGTINSVDIHPRTQCYCSGGEDGSVCLVKFGGDFLKAPFTSFCDSN